MSVGIKLVDGYWLPEREERVDELLRDSRALRRPAYQHHKVEAAAALVPADRRRLAVDVGAHVGMWTMQFLRLGFAKVVAFDPDPEKRECFMRNLAAHTLKEAGEAHADGFANVRHLTKALGALNGPVRLVHKTGTSLKTHVRPDRRGGLTMRRLDDVGLQDVDLLKIDVEGFELFVVRGAERTIKRDRPVIVVEQKKGVAQERYRVGDREAVDLLETWGYEVKAEFNGDYIMKAN